MFRSPKHVVPTLSISLRVTKYSGKLLMHLCGKGPTLYPPVRGKKPIISADEIAANMHVGQGLIFGLPNCENTQFMQHGGVDLYHGQR
jgi:hypothetical protein